NAERMVQMAVRQQDAVEPSEARATAQQLTLGALAAIHQHAVTSRLHQKPGMIALRRRDTRRGSKKGQVEHDRDDALIGGVRRLPWRMRSGELYLEPTARRGPR